MKLLKYQLFLGASLTIVGSFLPWESAGGFSDHDIYGFRVSPINFKYWVSGLHSLSVNDYGGGLVILLTMLIVLLALKPPKFVKNPFIWNLILSVVLMTICLFFVGRGLFHGIVNINSIEPPSIRPGLFSVVIGSVLLLWKALSIYKHKPRQPYSVKI
jgi:hypothetical protein